MTLPLPLTPNLTQSALETLTERGSPKHPGICLHPPLSIHPSIHLWIEGREPKTVRKEGQESQSSDKAGPYPSLVASPLVVAKLPRFFPHSLFNLTFPPKPSLFVSFGSGHRTSSPYTALSVSLPPWTTLPCVQLPLSQWIQTPRPVESEHCCWPRRRCAYLLDFLIDCLIDWLRNARLGVHLKPLCILLLWC